MVVQEKEMPYERAAIENMPTGFKQTEIGLIPSDWEVVTLGELGKWRGGGTPSKQNPEFWNGTIPWVSPKDFGPTLMSKSEDYITKQAIEKSSTALIPEDSILIVTRSGVLRNFVPIAKNIVAVTINQDVKALVVDKSNTVDYVFQALRNFGNEIKDNTVKVGTTVESIDFSAFRKFQIPFPPTLAEQRAIATALSDVDALITSLGALITKRRNIKQGAMQQLLTGKKRLPGFSGEWETKTLGSVSKVIRGASPRPQGDPRYYGGNVSRLMVSDVTRDGKYVTPEVDFLTEEGAKRSRPCKAGTLTIVCSGTVGVPSFLAVDACIHDGFLALVNVNSKVSEDYLYHKLSTLQEQLENSATHGGVFINLTTLIIKDFEVLLPALDEQRAIAKILSDMDAELDMLTQKRDKYKAVKQGMMQQLLTGKIRLI